MEKDRYFSIEFFDLYSHAVDYIGSRTTSSSGQFPIAGPIIMLKEKSNEYFLKCRFNFEYIRAE